MALGKVGPLDFHDTSDVDTLHRHWKLGNVELNLLMKFASTSSYCVPKYQSKKEVTTIHENINTITSEVTTTKYITILSSHVVYNKLT